MVRCAQTLGGEHEFISPQGHRYCRWCEAQPKTPILIHAWDGWSSGFDWEPASEESLVLLRKRYNEDVASGHYAEVVLTQIRVAGYSEDPEVRQSISDYIEGELQDALTLGKVGRIIVRHHTPE